MSGYVAIKLKMFNSDVDAVTVLPSALCSTFVAVSVVKHVLYRTQARKGVHLLMLFR